MKKSGFYLGLLLLASICPARTLAQQSATPPLPATAQAEKLLQSGQIEDAIALLAPQLAANTNDVRVNYLLGLAYYQKNDFAQTITHLSAALPHLPAGSQPQQQSVQLLGLSHYFTGHLKEAVPLLEETERTNPENVEIAYMLGNSYIQTRETDKSRAAFARLFKVAPASAAAHVINAQMMVRQQFEVLAEKELQRALEINPQTPQANFMLGELAIFRAEIERGVELLRKEIEINPAYAMAYYRLGEAYTRQLKWDEAVAPLQKSVWLNPFFSGPYIVLGKVYLKKRDLGNAASILRRALAMDPNNYSAHHLLAQVHQQSNRPEDARREFELAEKLRLEGEKKGIKESP